MKDQPWGWIRVLSALLVWGLLVPVRSQESTDPAAGDPPAPPTAPSVGAEGARSVVEEIPAPEWGEDYQVRVSGGSPRARVQFQVFVNEFRDDFRWLLFKLNVNAPEERHRWSVPILVRLWGDPRDVHTGAATRTLVEIGPDRKFLLKLEVKLHDRFDEDEFRLGLLETLLIEQILAPHASNPSTFALDEVSPPDWVVHGFDQLIRNRRGGSPSSYYRGFLESGQILKPAELFAVSEAASLDPVRYAIFQASAAAMVEALLDQPDGDFGFRGFLGDLGRPGTHAAEALLRQHFPAFREMDQGLEKWWALELANLGQQQGLEFLSPQETDRLLTEALTLRFEAVATPLEGQAEEAGGKKGFLDWLRAKPKVQALPPQEAFVGSIEQYDQFLDRAGAKERLTASFDRIQTLKRAGFPLYRPVFTAYERAIARLLKNDTRDLGAEFASIGEMRRKITETLERSRDYLNHFEATRAPRLSGEFDEYFRIRESYDQRARPRKSDPITRYLDALEAEFR